MNRLIQFMVGSALLWGVFGGLFAMFTFGYVAVIDHTPNALSALSSQEFAERSLVVRVLCGGIALVLGLVFSVGLALHQSVEVASKLKRWDLVWKLCGVSTLGSGMVAVLCAAICAIAFREGVSAIALTPLLVLAIAGFCLILPVVRDPQRLSSTRLMVEDLVGA